MKNDSNRLKILIQHTIRDSLDKINYKKMKNYSNCSKCGIMLTKDNCKKDRTICKKCFNDNVMH